MNLNWGPSIGNVGIYVHLPWLCETDRVAGPKLPKTWLSWVVRGNTLRYPFRCPFLVGEMGLWTSWVEWQRVGVHSLV